MSDKPADLKDAFAGQIDPLALFDAWLEEAKAKEINDPTGMALATVDPTGLPDVRMVLLKGHDARGFVFFTNFESAKGQELIATPKAALLFHWKSLRRQVRIRGRWCRWRRRRRTTISQAARATAASALGLRISRVRWRAASPWKSGWRNMR
jgi:pyridoxine/pyridoxamine 5'-phosphate oxidase